MSLRRATGSKIGSKERIAARPAPKNQITGTWVSLPGRRVAYAVKGGPLHLDGAPGPAGEGARKLSFSADGTSHAYYLKRGDDEILVVDGRERCAYRRFGEDAPVWNGQRCACIARRGDTWWILVDGEPRFGPFRNDRAGWGGEACTQLAWSAHGLSYAVIRGESMQFELEGEPLGRGFPFVYDLAFGGTAGNHAYRASKGEVWSLAWCSKVLGPFGQGGRPRFACDGTLWFFGGGRDAMTGSTFDTRVYADFQAIASYQAVDQLVLARDAPSHAVIATDAMFGRGYRFVVHGDRRWRDRNNLFDLSITPDGAHVSAVTYDEMTYSNADRTLYTVLRDDAVVARAPWIDLWSTALSDDGAHVAFVASDARSSPRPHCRVHVGRRVQSEPIDALHSELRFAPDGTSVSFIAERRGVMSAHVLGTR